MLGRALIKRRIKILIRCLNININFNEYSELNPDVSLAGMHPIHHFIRYGWHENRLVARGLSSDALLLSNNSLRRTLKYLSDGKSLAIIDTIFDPKQPPESKNDIRFIGYVESKLGLGTATRGMINCFRLSSARFSIYPYGHGASDRFDSKFQVHRYDTYSYHKINIFELGLDYIDLAFDQVNQCASKKSYNILKLYWELSEIPPEKVAALNRYDEIWAPSKFVYDAVAKVFDRNIFIIPPYVDIHSVARLPRSHFGLSDKKFYFIFSFDYNSSIHRKNPFAVVRAFQAAFPLDVSSVGLVIKTNNASTSSSEAAAIESLKKTDKRIVVIEDYLDRNTMLSLIRCCDCYVSLHRSEGYGMGMAEAICLGRKVVATNYSGNTDFMNRHNSFPVNYVMIPVQAGHYPHAEGNTWADPIHGSAVEQLRLAFQQKTNFFGKLIRMRLSYRRSIPRKKQLARMLSSRIRAVKKFHFN